MMEGTIGGRKPSSPGSIEELASFWDSHDLTDLEQTLEEACEPAFVRMRKKSKPPSFPPDKTPRQATRRTRRG